MIEAGEPIQAAQFRIAPERVRIWTINPRIYGNLSAENTSELISSIRSDGQKSPVIVRPLHGDLDYQYELIAGARRHFAVSYLRQHDVPGLMLLVQVEQLDDVAAFRLADLENRVRKDISDLERARNYVYARDAFYGGKQSAMARDLQISRSWLSRMITAASLPDEVVAAFEPDGLEMKPAYTLAQALSASGKDHVVREFAKIISAKQDRLRTAGDAPMTSQAIMKRLLDVVRPANKEQIPQPPKSVWRSRAGKPILTIQAKDAAGMTIRIHQDSGAEAGEIVTTFADALRYL